MRNVIFVFVTMALKEMVLFAKISTSAYPKNFIRALLTPNVKTPLAPTGAFVSRDTMVMDKCAQTLMNAAPVFTIVVSMHIATIALVLINVVVLKDSKEMACHVRMWTNANWPI